MKSNWREESGKFRDTLLEFLNGQNDCDCADCTTKFVMEQVNRMLLTQRKTIGEAVLKIEVQDYVEPYNKGAIIYRDDVLSIIGETK